MRRFIGLPLLLLFILTGCSASKGQEATLQADNDSLQRQVKRLQAQEADLEEQLKALRTQNEERMSQLPVSSTPKYVCAGLVQYFYTEVSRGRKPVELLDQQVQVGFASVGYPEVQNDLPVEKVDFAPVMKWVKENPITLVRDVYLPLSQPGYQRVDMELTNGFYVSSICQQYRISRFLILDHSPGET